MKDNALKIYGRHLPECSCLKGDPDCDCGFAEALMKSEL